MRPTALSTAVTRYRETEDALDRASIQPRASHDACSSSANILKSARDRFGLSAGLCIELPRGNARSPRPHEGFRLPVTYKFASLPLATKSLSFRADQ